VLVRMRIGRVMQDAGRERPLARGERYDLPDPVAQALIATGAAVAEPAAAAPGPEMDPEGEGGADPGEAAGLRAPESKPDAPPETGRGRGGRGTARGAGRPS
jgi:hypothetical protein